MKYRAEIDGLRALAVLPVILFHGGFEWFSGGFVGVDVFFVISGYLISTIIISEIMAGNFSIVNFYERRARRILPALFFAMAVCLPFAWLWLTSNDLRDFGQSLVAVSIFSSNILFWSESGYFDTAAELKPLLHTWSLAVEEQYYIIFPIFLVLAWRLGVKFITGLLVMVFFLSLGLAVWGTQYATHPKIVSGAFFLLPTRGWELLVGVFVALYLRYNTHLTSHTVNQVLSLLGFSMVVFSIIFFDSSTPFPSVYALVPTLGTGLLILCAIPKTLVYNLFCLKPIVGVGLISYSAYLWHQPLFAFARHQSSGEVSNHYLFVLCIASLSMAWFSWKFVEKPFRDKNVTSRRAVFSMSIAGIVAFIIIGFHMDFKEGFYDHFVKQNPDIKSGDIGHTLFHQRVKVLYEECSDSELKRRAAKWDDLLRCQQTSSNKPKVVVFGDSHAEHLFLGLAEASSEEIIYLIRGGHAFVGEETHQYLIDYIIENEGIETVVYSAHWYKKFEDFGESGFYENVSNTLKTFSQAGKKLVVVADVPDFVFDARDCYFVLKYNSAKSSCDLDSSEFEAQRTYVSALRSLASSHSADFVDPAGLFCSEENKCNMIKDGVILYRDNDHLNIPGSLLTGKYVFENSSLLH